MSAGLQIALAHILVDREVRLALAADRHAIQQRFDLTDYELAGLAAIDPSRLELSAWAVSAKRLDFLERALPATIGCFGGHCHDRRLVTFVESRPPVEVDGQPNRLIAESQRFLAYLVDTHAADVPPFVGELARYELMRLQLLHSSEASDSAQQATRDPELLFTAVLQVGPHVALGRFRFDVLELAETRPPHPARVVEPRDTSLALVKHAQRGAVGAYRIGRFVHDLLVRWQVPRRADELLESGDAEDRVRAVARTALDEGLLVVAGR